MKVLALNCNRCGAPLAVPLRTRYLTCGYCSTRLEVHPNGGAACTRTLETLSAKTDRIAGDVEVLKLQNRLEQLDREWTMGLQRYMVRGHDGEYSLPTRVGSILFIIVTAIIGIGWIGFATAIPAPEPFIPWLRLFGFLVLGLAAAGGFVAVSRVRDYEEAQRNYHRRRRELLQEIQKRSGHDEAGA